MSGYSTNRMKSNRKRNERDFYPTPYGLAFFATRELVYEFGVLSGDEYILDVGAGTGIWGKAMLSFIGKPPARAGRQFVMDGIDIEGENPGYYDSWYKEDYLSFLLSDNNFGYELVIGNPPFSLMEEFVRKSYECLSSTGHIYLLGRLAFLESRKRFEGLYRDIPLRKVYVLVRRPSYFSTNNENKTTDTLAYAMYLWEKGYEGKPEIGWLDWDYIDE